MRVSTWLGSSGATGGVLAGSGMVAGGEAATSPFTAATGAGSMTGGSGVGAAS